MSGASGAPIQINVRFELLTVDNVDRDRILENIEEIKTHDKFYKSDSNFRFGKKNALKSANLGKRKPKTRKGTANRSRVQKTKKKSKWKSQFV